MFTVFANLKEHGELVGQYFALRNKRRLGSAYKVTDGAVQGDGDAVFLLAVDETDDGPRVVGGMRVNRVNDLPESPLGHIEATKLEHLFPGVKDVQHKYRVLNVDHAFTEAGRTDVIPRLLDDMLNGTKGPAHDFVFFMPDERFGRVLTHFLSRRGQRVIDLGMVSYNSRHGMAVSKPLLGVIYNDELERHIKIPLGLGGAER